MSDNTGIEWTDATWSDRGGRRVRSYQRVDKSRPGQRRRREMRAIGLAWCRGCSAWKPCDEVSQGACRPCLNAEARVRYANDPGAIRLRVHARKRAIDPIPLIGAEYLVEQFEGLCAYCPAEADTWDHVLAVARGGRTESGNVVPACRSCNSSKKDRDVFEWLESLGRSPLPRLLEVVALGVAC